MRLHLSLALAAFALSLPAQAQLPEPPEAYKSVAAQVASQVAAWCPGDVQLCLDDLFQQEPGNPRSKVYPADRTVDSYGASIDGVYRLESTSGWRGSEWANQNRRTSLLLILKGKYFRIHVGASTVDPTRFSIVGNMGKIGLPARLDRSPYAMEQTHRFVIANDRIVADEAYIPRKNNLKVSFTQPAIFTMTNEAEDRAEGVRYEEIWEAISRESASNSWLRLLLGL